MKDLMMCVIVNIVWMLVHLWLNKVYTDARLHDLKKVNTWYTRLTGRVNELQRRIENLERMHENDGR